MASSSGLVHLYRLPQKPRMIHAFVLHLQNAAGILVAGSLGGALYLKKQEADGFEEVMR